MQDVVLVGAGGFAKELLGYLHETSLFNPVALLVDRDADTPEQVLGVPVADLSSFNDDQMPVLLAVGDPMGKELITRRAEVQGFNWASYVDPRAHISGFAKIGKGSIVAPFAVAAGDCQIGDFCLLNAFTGVGHDARLCAFCSLMPGATVTGGVTLGEAGFIGPNATITPDLTLGDRCRVSAGTTVFKDAEADHLIAGSPAMAHIDVFSLKERKRHGLPPGDAKAGGA